MCTFGFYSSTVLENRMLPVDEIPLKFRVYNFKERKWKRESSIWVIFWHIKLPSPRPYKCIIGHQNFNFISQLRATDQIKPPMNRNICGQIFNGKKGQYSLSRRFQFLSFMMLWGKTCFRFLESSRFEATAFWECPREEREVATLKKPFHLLSPSSFYASRSQMDFHILCKVKRAGCWMESSHLASSWSGSY